jgi:TonB-linked SusC/RagA family outer membrane protein
MKKYIFLWIMSWMTVLPLSAQQKIFDMGGTIYDETGETFPGVTVYLKDKTGVGTSSDINGKFSIKAEYGDKIVFSFLGYNNIELVVLEENKSLEIRMTISSNQLEEVVVTGLGTTQRKISSVAAVSTLDTKDLQIPVTSVANLLGGRIAGVFSMQTSGEPGKNISEFWVRGIGTFGASSGALVLIDGLEGNINAIDPADIESFSVLKDASATAVYGVRGANGVVLVTTKRGEEGKLKITGRANWSLSHLRRVPKYLRAYDYALLANEAEIVRGHKPLYSTEDLSIIESGLDRDLFPDVSWQDEILNRNSFRQNYYVSANGGGSVAKYFVSLGGSSESAAYKYDKESPYASNVGYNTYSYRTNLDIDLSKTSKIFFGTDGYLSITNTPGMANTDYIWQAQSQINPLYMPTIYSNGYYPGVNSGSGSSPWVLINRTGRATNQDYKSKVTLAFSQDLSFLLDGLRFRMQGAYDTQSIFAERRFIQPALYTSNERKTDGSLVMRPMVAATPASYSNSKNMYRKYHFETTVNYDKIFGEDHRVSGLVYYYLSDQKNTWDITTQPSISSIPVRYQGVSSRFTYSLKDTYMIDLNFGYTGSENFQPGHQYGFFPSVALGWVPTSYEWMRENHPWVSFFKIRASYGAVGNDRLAGATRFPYMTKAQFYERPVYESMGSIETLIETTPGADNLEWEKALKANIGIEGKFLNDRIAFVVDFFNDQRNGIFQPRNQVPGYVGLIKMPYGNVGRMRSFGADGNASYRYEINKDANFTLRGNFTWSDNKIQNWEQPYMDYPYQEYTGFPYNSIRGFQSLGLFKDEEDIRQSAIQTSWGKVEPGDIKYKDCNGDGKIDDDDKVPLSRTTMPVLMYGFGGEFRYKHLTAGILFKGTGKTDFYYVGQTVTRNNVSYQNGMGYIPFYDGVSGNVLAMANDPANRWIPMDYALAHGIDPSLAENPNARFPKLQYGRNVNNSQLSDFWKGDARYLRLQEVTLSYNLTAKWLKKVKISSVDLQLIGSNIYVWDKVKTFDPEQAQFNGAVYPIPAVYSIQLYIYL